MKPVFEKELREPVLDKDGNPVINQYGHAITPRLTDNEIQYVIELLARGKSVRSIALELETTETRIRQIRDNQATIDKAMKFQRDTLLHEQIERLTDFLYKQSQQIDELANQVSHLVTHQKKMNVALRYRTIDNKQLRQTVSSLRKERKELRDLYHRHTGKKPDLNG